MQKRQETLVRSLGRGDPLEKETAVYSSIPAWIMPWIEEPGGLQSKLLQRVRHNSVTSMQAHKWYLDFWLPGGSVFLTPCCSKVNCCIQQRSKWSNLQSIVPKMIWLSICLPHVFLLVSVARGIKPEWMSSYFYYHGGMKAILKNSNLLEFNRNLPQVGKFSENFSFLCKLAYSYYKYHSHPTPSHRDPFI